MKIINDIVFKKLKRQKAFLVLLTLVSISFISSVKIRYSISNPFGDFSHFAESLFSQNNKKSEDTYKNDDSEFYMKRPKNNLYDFSLIKKDNDNSEEFKLKDLMRYVITPDNQLDTLKEKNTIERIYYNNKENHDSSNFMNNYYGNSNGTNDNKNSKFNLKKSFNMRNNDNAADYSLNKKIDELGKLTNKNDYNKTINIQKDSSLKQIISKHKENNSDKTQMNDSKQIKQMLKTDNLNSNSKLDHIRAQVNNNNINAKNSNILDMTNISDNKKNNNSVVEQKSDNKADLLNDIFSEMD